jgi:hypothetical protein
MEFSSYLSSIKMNPFSVDKSSFNLLVRVAYLFWKYHVSSSQLIIVGINHLIVVFQQPIFLLQMFYSYLYLVELSFYQVDLFSLGIIDSVFFYCYFN